MGSNSVFDDIGLGGRDIVEFGQGLSTQLGLSQDPKKVARDNERKLEAQRQEMLAQEQQAERKKYAEQDADRRRFGSRSNTVLTGGQGIEDEEEGFGVSRRTLLGS